MTPLQKAVKALLDCPETACTRDNFCELHRALAAELQQAVEPVAFMTDDGRVAMAITVNEAMPKASKANFCIPLYLHPPQQVAVPSGERAELIADLRLACIDGTLNATLVNKAADMLEADAQQATVKQYLKVGDSRFESWYSELNQAGKGGKQIAREAYEAGLNEADAQQAKQVPMTGDELEFLVSDIAEWSSHVQVDTAPTTLAKHVEKVLAHHGIGGLK